MNEIMNVGCQTPKQCYDDREESLSEKLERRRERAQAELDRIQSAIDALKENPKIAEVMDLVIKACR